MLLLPVNIRSSSERHRAMHVASHILQFSSARHLREHTLVSSISEEPIETWRRDWMERRGHLEEAPLEANIVGLPGAKTRAAAC